VRVAFGQQAGPPPEQFLVGLAALIMDDSDVVAGTAGNTVTMTGHVRTWAEHDAVIDAAWMASGVYDVIDDPVITG
jgi:osmotically-inducible protein OsmY